MALHQPLDPAMPEASQPWTFHLHEPIPSWLDLALYHLQLKECRLMW